MWGGESGRTTYSELVTIGVSWSHATKDSCLQEFHMPTKNRQILLASRPSGEPTPDNFKLIESEIPTPGPGQVLLRTIYLSLDPYMRGRMNAGKSYAKPVEVGEVMEGRAVGEVVESKLP